MVHAAHHLLQVMRMQAHNGPNLLGGHLPMCACAACVQQHKQPVKPCLPHLLLLSSSSQVVKICNTAQHFSATANTQTQTTAHRQQTHSTQHTDHQAPRPCFSCWDRCLKQRCCWSMLLPFSKTQRRAFMKAAHQFLGFLQRVSIAPVLLFRPPVLCLFCPSLPLIVLIQTNCALLHTPSAFQWA